MEGCLLLASFQLSNLIWNQVTFLQRREGSLTWRVEVDDVFHGEVPGLGGSQTVSQQTEDQQPGQGGAGFHGRPRLYSSRGPGSGDSRRWKRICTWNTKPESSQCLNGESHRGSAQLLLAGWVGEKQGAQGTRMWVDRERNFIDCNFRALRKFQPKSILN